MYRRQRIGLAVLLSFMLLVLSGCTTAVITLTFQQSGNPTVNTLVLDGTETEIGGALTIAASAGFLYSTLKIDTVSWVAYDGDDEVIPDLTGTAEINKSIPVIGKASYTHNQTFAFSYDDIVSRGVARIEITVTGKPNATLSIAIETTGPSA
ncbi:MAG TPA: hypothetical protein GXZ82_13775 [Firmicutes bacterium]|jgi:uncharacterized protein YceK|nr:hypothetical protein [Bacillota bacterium]